MYEHLKFEPTFADKIEEALNVVSNHFPVKVEDFEVIYIFSVHFNPKIPLDNTTLRRRLLDDNK